MRLPFIQKMDQVDPYGILLVWNSDVTKYGIPMAQPVTCPDQLIKSVIGWGFLIEG